MLEVEIKAVLNDSKAAEIEKSAKLLGFAGKYERTEEDAYYDGNNRSFVKTDEALRLRTVTEKGIESTLITYKGPKQGNLETDKLSNSRLELETGVDNSGTMKRILEELGYKRVMTVKKNRKVLELDRESDTINLCIDEVESLGSFAELEIVCSGENCEEQKKAALDGLLSMAKQLGIDESDMTQKTYLELLMER